MAESEPQTSHDQNKGNANKEGGGGIITGIANFFGMGESPSQADPTEQADDILIPAGRRDKYNKRTRQHLDDGDSKMAALERNHAAQLRSLNKQTQERIEGMEHDYQIKEDLMANARSELEWANNKIASLKKRVAEDEAKLSKVYAAAVLSLAQEVSREYPDDVVKSDIKKFFQGDFFSWCADLCVSNISDPEETAEGLVTYYFVLDTDKQSW